MSLRYYLLYLTKTCKSHLAIIFPTIMPTMWSLIEENEYQQWKEEKINYSDEFRPYESN